MQLSGGTIAVNTGATTVTGTGTDWQTNNVIPGQSIFAVTGETTLYTITALNAGAQTLTITPAYQGNSNLSGHSAYAIHTDFTPSLGLALLARGDVNPAQIFNRNMRLIEDIVSQGGLPASSSDTSTGTDYTITMAETPQIGSVVAFNASTQAFVLADAGDADKRLVVGVVVAKTPNIIMRTAGRISSIEQNLSIGVQYLASGGGASNLSATPPGGSDPTVVVLTGTATGAGTSVGFIRSIRSSDSRFTTTADGQVPNPGSVLGYVLSDDGTWKPPSVADDSLRVRHLYTGSVKYSGGAGIFSGASVFPLDITDPLYESNRPAWWNNFRQQSTDDQFASILQAILDLYQVSLKVDAKALAPNSHRWDTFTPGMTSPSNANPYYEASWVVPDGVRAIRVTAAGVGGSVGISLVTPITIQTVFQATPGNVWTIRVASYQHRTASPDAHTSITDSVDGLLFTIPPIVRSNDPGSLMADIVTARLYKPSEVGVSNQAGQIGISLGFGTRITDSMFVRDPYILLEYII